MDTSKDKEQEEFEVEISDLTQPGNVSDSKSSRFARTLLGWQRTAQRRRLGVFSALGLSLLVVLVILLGLARGLAAHFLTRSLPRAVVSTPGPPEIRPSVHIFPQQIGFACVMDAMWSPDSKQIALLGYQRDCPQNDQMYMPGLVTVYDAYSGKLLERLSPDNAILHALRGSYPGEYTAAVIYYNAILWSPDGQLLTLLFSVIDGSDVNASRFDGMLLTDVDSGHTQVLLQRDKTSTFHYVEWDLEYAKLVPTVPAPSTAPLFPFLITVSPAYTYSWGKDGALIPQTWLTNSVLPSILLPGPVGNPIGDSSFTIWQPGRVEYTTQTENGSTQAVGIMSWDTVFAAWSPDSRYLAYPIVMAGLLEPSNEYGFAQMLKRLQLDPVPLLAVRDTAMQHILESLPKVNPIESAMVSWRFDGRVLAAYSSDVVTLGLYDCTTGKELASLQIPKIYRGPLSGSSWMRWSPDGSRLFLLDRILGLTVWKTG
jgi:WD40 repeat protein